MLMLSVGLDPFIAECKRRLPNDAAYLHVEGGHAHLTAADVRHRVLLSCRVNLSEKEVRAKLADAKIECRTGQWNASTGSDSATNGTTEAAYIAAVAYRSHDAKPGLWVDAYAAEPTAQEVLTNFFREMEENAEISATVSFEDFLRLANPNVVIVRPEELRYHLDQKNP